MNLSPERSKIMNALHPYSMGKMEEARRSKMRFVHYSSGEAALGLIRSKKVWMRKANCMNDFMEIEHGLQCLRSTYLSEVGQLFRDTVDSMFPGLSAHFQQLFDSWIPAFKNDTFLTCMSEHLPEEDVLGRLSMWRAYGGLSGVAIVLRSDPFLGTSDALKAYTSPVSYSSVDGFQTYFSEICRNIEHERDFFSSLDRSLFLGELFHLFRYLVLCTKHPGFHEEREWRVIYSPSFSRSTRIEHAVESVRGVPQPICKIPLVDLPEEGLVGISIPEFVERVIIGPTQYPFAVRDAFVALLLEADVADAASRVFFSEIPLRQ